MEEKMRQGRSTNMLREAIVLVSICLNFPRRNPAAIMRKRGSMTSTMNIMRALARAAFKGLEKKNESKRKKKEI
jgi:hypothetical protein